MTDPVITPYVFDLNYKNPAHVPIADFAEHGFQADERVGRHPENIQKQVLDFLKTLNAPQKIAYHVAFDQLNTAFDIIKTHGFLKWKKNNEGQTDM